MEGIIVLGIIVLFIFSIKRYMKNITKGCCGSGGDEVDIQDQNINNYLYHIVCEVKGMSCGNCAKRIENALYQQMQAYSKANYRTGKVNIYLKEEMNHDIIISIIARNGFEVIKISN